MNAMVAAITQQVAVHVMLKGTRGKKLLFHQKDWLNSVDKTHRNFKWEHDLDKVDH